MTAPPRSDRLRLLYPLIVAVMLGLGIDLVREATQSRHHETDPNSRVRVVVAPRSRQSEPSQSVEQVLWAHLSFCELEVGSQLVGDLTPLSADPVRYAVTMAPALDATDRKQFRGCVEDWAVDNHLVDVVSMEEYQVR